MNKPEQNNLVANLAGDLGQVKDEQTRYIMLSHFHKADAVYGEALAKALKADAAKVKGMVADLAEKLLTAGGLLHIRRAALTETGHEIPRSKLSFTGLFGQPTGNRTKD